ncbi:MAG: DUF2490 domain-containing protein [Pseudomonadota bacterium]
MTVKYLFILVAILLSFITSICFASFTSRYSNWLGFDVGGSFHKDSKWHYDLMNQARVPTDPTRLEQYFVRPSVFYQLDKNWSFWLGSDLIYENPKNDPTTTEQRIWPQIEYDKSLTYHVATSLRSRLENRWIGNQSGMAMRFRQRVEFSINHWNKYNVDLDVFDEGFFGLKRPSWVTDRTFDQNRVFLGFVIPMHKRLAIDTGYLNIFRPRSPQNRVEHILVLALAINFDGKPSFPIRTV